MPRFLLPPLLLLGLLLLGGSLPAQSPPGWRAIDRRARQAPDSLRTDLPGLTAYLLRDLDRDEDKVRALYAWITHHIAYDHDAAPAGRWRLNRNVDDILRRGRAICFGYALLFRALCDEAGLRCVTIGGYSKGTPTARPTLDEPDHAWVAVEIDGEWRLLDPTWGVYLTPPEAFVRSHLPTAPMWQLLPCPVPLEVFAGSEPEIETWLTGRAPCLAYRDSIDAWLALPPPARALAGARAAYRFNPTAANAVELGHAYLDYAGRLSDRADSLRAGGRLPEFLATQDTLLRACDAARIYADTLYAWQQELCLGARLNQAVACVQQADAEPGERENYYRRAVEHLEAVRAQAEALPAGSLYGQQVARQAERYLRQLRPWIDP